MRSIHLILAFLAAFPSAYAAQDAAESALSFVKKIETGRVDLAPNTDTAIISEISPNKEESINQRLQRLELELKGNEIQIGPTRVEGTLAGVIIRMINPTDPMDIRVLPLAMVRGGGIWRAAPVPASFENTVATYSRSSRDIARELELWLAREQAIEVERLRKSAGSLLRESLARTISPEAIRAWTAEKAVSEFLSACETGSTPRILALLGGLSATLPEDWQQLVASVNTATTSQGDGFSTWSRLTSPAVFRLLVWDKEASDQDGSFRVLFLDPRIDKENSVLQQTCTVRADADGLWQIQVPGSPPEVVGEDTIRETFVSSLPHSYPVKPMGSALELKKSLVSSLQSHNSPQAWANLIPQEGEMVTTMARYMKAVSIRWQTMNRDKPVIPVELGFHEEAEHAHLALQWLALGKPVFAPMVLHFQKGSEGWMWNPLPNSTQATSAEIWVKKNEATWKNSFLELAVKSCALPDTSLPSPTEEESAAVVNEWLDALLAANWNKALSLCAQLNTPKSPTLLLRNLWYECKSLQPASKPPLHEIVQRGSFVTLVATRSADDRRSIYSLLPVVSTPSGPRILLEIDLGEPSRPGRAFLNRNALERLSPTHPTMAEELKEMLSGLTKENPE